MAKQFIEESAEREGLGYLDGFRFGMGFFIAWTLGVALVSGVVTLALMLLRH